MTLILSNEDISQILDVRACLECLEDAYREMAFGRVINLKRIDIEAPISESGFKEGSYELKTMAAIIPKHGIAALRFISAAHTVERLYGTVRNQSLGLAPGGRYVGLIVLFSVETLEPLAILQDGYIRNLRVAGTAAIAGKYLARQDASVLGLLGSGWMAAAHLEAFCQIRAINKAIVYSPNKEHRISFAKSMTERLGVDVVPVEKASQAIVGSHIAIAATSSKEPVLMGSWIEPGTFYTSVTSQELDAEAVEKADVKVLHSRETYETHLLGKGQYGHIYLGDPMSEYRWSEHVKSRLKIEKLPLLEEVIVGKAKGRSFDWETATFFNTPGLGMQFAAVGAQAYRLAKSRNLGKEIDTNWFTQSMRTG